MLGWTIVMMGITLIGVMVISTWKQRRAGHIAYWQQHQKVEQRKGEAASRLPDPLERHQPMDHAKASVVRIDGELPRLARSKGPVGHRVS
jgi:hypothetical protein